MSEVYTVQGTVQLGLEVEDGCQTERGPAEQVEEVVTLARVWEPLP